MSFSLPSTTSDTPRDTRRIWLPGESLVAWCRPYWNFGRLSIPNPIAAVNFKAGETNAGNRCYQYDRAMQGYIGGLTSWDDAGIFLGLKEGGLIQNQIEQVMVQRWSSYV